MFTKEETFNSVRDEQHERDDMKDIGENWNTEETPNILESELIARPKLPAWAVVLGLRPVQVHQSVGNRQRILRREDRRTH